MQSLFFYFSQEIGFIDISRTHFSWITPIKAVYIYVQNYGERNLKDKYVVIIEQTGQDVNPCLGTLLQL